MVAQAAAQGAEVVALPEYFCLMGHADRDKLGIAEADQGTAACNNPKAPIQTLLSQTARELGLWVIGGTLPLRAKQAEHVRNACCVYAPSGERVARYDKLHLFRYDNGRERYDESVVLEQGDEPVVAEIGPWRTGLSVCYDMRFPELYRAMSFMPGERPCDLIACPAAFTYATGQAHWDLLLRARAVENQAYVIASAQGGQHANGRRTWGHSMIIDPWGEVLACLPEGEGLALAEISAERLKAVRAQLPALQHRRC